MQVGVFFCLNTMKNISVQNPSNCIKPFLLGCQMVEVEAAEELSIDADFPIIEETTEKPGCMRAPEAGVLFDSDNFPGKYLKDTNCTYTMRAAEGRRVQLTFFIFDVSLLLGTNYSNNSGSWLELKWKPV